MTLKPIKTFAYLFIFLSALNLTSCKEKDKKSEETVNSETTETTSDSLFFKLSLAEWSLHEPIQNGDLDPMDFAKTASEMGFSGIEYVNSFYAERIKMQMTLNRRCRPYWIASRRIVKNIRLKTFL